MVPPVHLAPPHRSNLRPLLPALAAGWLIAIGVAVWQMVAYANTPGPAAADAPSIWPPTSRIVREDGRPTLLMLAHPKCPCTRASLDELAALLHEVGPGLDAHVLFMRPAGVEEDWAKSDLWTKAEAIPGVRVMVDEDGLEATRFDAKTSGQTLVYGPDGTLLFGGGITAARGHEGDNLGRARIRALLSRQEEIGDADVYGCLLGVGAPGPGASRL